MRVLLNVRLPSILSTSCLPCSSLLASALASYLFKKGLPQHIAAFGIAGGSVSALFSSHPPIEERIIALQQPVGRMRYAAAW